MYIYIYIYLYICLSCKPTCLPHSVDKLPLRRPFLALRWLGLRGGQERTGDDGG